MTFSAIVPVYNEGGTVTRVIQTLLDSGLITEIICVNDGSTDNSLEKLQEFGGKIKILNFSANHGKGRAIAAGISRAGGDYLFFCDSDLLRFTKKHVENMLTPIVQGKYKVVFGVPTQNKSGHYARHEVYLAGERVYPRAALLPHVSRLSRSKGAGASEVFLNTLFAKKEVKVVPLYRLYKPLKAKKWAPQVALRQYLLSAVGILQEIGRIEIHSASDLRKLQNLVQVDTLAALKTKVEDIKNKHLKEVLKKYFWKYMV